MQITDSQIVITAFSYKIKPEKTGPLSATSLPLFFLPPSLNVSYVVNSRVLSQCKVNGVVLFYGNQRYNKVYFSQPQVGKFAINSRRFSDTLLWYIADECHGISVTGMLTLAICLHSCSF